MNFWYKKSLIAYLLLPLSALFGLISFVRRFLYQHHFLKSYRAKVSVLVVGNLSVGGNGKTPVTIWLVQQCQRQGIKVGVISRGYGSQAPYYPYLVNAQTDPIQGGDEPVLIAKRTGVPVCISANRQHAIEHLLQHHPCDLIIADDGLQHYKLQRDWEIVVMDAERGLGNGFLLPAGPLREGAKRLQDVDLIIANGQANAYSQAVMKLVPQYAINLVTQQKRPLCEFDCVNAIAGIGNPQRFFTMLQDLGMTLEQCQAFQDHQAFSAALLEKLPKNRPLFMTEKDAVKCQAFAQSHWWYVPVEAEITGQPASQLLQKIVSKIQH